MLAKMKAMELIAENDHARDAKATISRVPATPPSKL
jgi:hypothetical protein